MNLLSLKFSIGSHFTKMKAEKKIQPQKKKSLGFSHQDSKCNTALYGHCSMKDIHASTLER